MTNTLQLEFDEGILLESENVSWKTSENIKCTNLVLTNKNIYCVYEKSNGLFKKATNEVDILPLDDIKIINGQALVQQVKHEDSWCLQIQFRQRTEYFIFYESPKKVIPKWVTAINNSLGIVPNETASVSSPDSKIVKFAKPFGGVFAGTAEAFAGVADSLKTVVDNAAGTMKQTTERNTTVAEDYSVDEEADYSVSRPVKEPKRKNSFCMNCGANLISGAKFCPSCGNKVGGIENSTKTVTEKTEVTPLPVPTVQEKNITPPMPNPQRQQEYVGTILKCPNCGAVIGETTVVCPDCGIRITGRTAVTSVQAFKDQIMAIESNRKRGLGEMFGKLTAAPDPVDTKKLSLIRNFPIPNTVDDIMEFMFLAVANIDVALSKNTIMNKWNSTDGETIEKTISNAWISKMQQTYKKAEIMFPNDPIFPDLQRLYFDKMKELKIKV